MKELQKELQTNLTIMPNELRKKQEAEEKELAERNARAEAYIAKCNRKRAYKADIRESNVTVAIVSSILITFYILVRNGILF